MEVFEVPKLRVSSLLRMSGVQSDSVVESALGQSEEGVETSFETVFTMGSGESIVVDYGVCRVVRSFREIVLAGCYFYAFPCHRCRRLSN